MAGQSDPRPTALIRGPNTAEDEANPCLNNCGYYGSEKLAGFCSKCHKEMTLAATEPRDTNQLGVGSLSGSQSRHNETDSTSTRVHETKPKKKKLDSKHQLNKGQGSATKVKAEKSSAKQPTSALVSNLTSFLKKPPRPMPSQSQEQNTTRKFDFAVFSRNPNLKDCHDYILGAVHKLSAEGVMTPEQYSKLVQGLYKNVESRYLHSSAFKSELPEEHWDPFMEGLEKTVMNKLYSKVFDMPSSEEFGKDWWLHRKITLLWWVEPSHLDITLDLDRADVTLLLEDAKKELTRMHQRKAPQDKLGCLCRCCELIFSSLKASNDGPASADDFLPAMIYLILVTNPPRLHANLNYIQRFSCPERIASGETGYYFTNLVGTVAFIERVTHENLNISEEDYKRKMGIGVGKTILDAILGSTHFNQREPHLQAAVEARLQDLKECSVRQHLLQVETGEWQQEMAEFREGLRDQVANTLKDSPHVIHWGST